jgi:hypothetical protein
MSAIARKANKVALRAVLEIRRSMFILRPSEIVSILKRA